MTDRPRTAVREAPRAWLARILDCPPDTLGEDSSIVTHPAWDSFAQVTIMVHLAEHYGLEMTEESVARYTSYAAIRALHAEVAGAGEDVGAPRR